MTVRLRPSFVRSSFWITVALLVVTAIAYFWQAYRENHWWTSDYMLSMLIPLALAPVIVWSMFVPVRLEFSDTQFIIQFPFRPLHTLDWSALEYYGSGENVFMIQFAGVCTFQVFAQAFRGSEWRMLENFLSFAFPDKKASGYIGDRMFKWPRRKT